MNYDMFTREIKKGVEKIVREKIGEGIVVIRNVTKNNNVRMKAISIMRKEEKATPTIYLKNYYNEYKKGKEIADICQEIFDVYKKGLKTFCSDIDISELNNFDKIKGKIYYKLIHYERNRNLLKDVPYFKFLDMAIVFFILFSAEEEQQATALIHNQHMAGWGIDVIQLRDVAFSNTWNKFPPVIQKMEDIISGMILNDIMDEEDEDFFSDEIREDCRYGEYTYREVEQIIKEEVEHLKADREMEMYVLTNAIRNYGATCITYPGLLKDFARQHGKDVYIIPSSVHEVILIPDYQWSKEKLDEMVVEVNETELDPVDILSDHVYIYRRETQQIE